MKIKILFASLIICSVLAGCSYLKNDSEEIHIAVAGTSDFRDAVNLYVDEINEHGGIDGRKMVADYFNDQHNPDTAFQKASEIANKNQAVAVIGHYESACSARAGSVYKEHGIPAITPTSAADDVTVGNEWYFRTAFTDTRQGRFLSIYAKTILKADAASIIYGDGFSRIAETFEKNAGLIGLGITYKQRFDKKAEVPEQAFKRIAGELLAKTNPGVIFLAVTNEDGTQIIKALRDAGIPNPVLGPAGFCSEAFFQNFNHYPEEIKKSGYYTKDIYAVSPLIFDSANMTAQEFQKKYRDRYRRNPGWEAAFAYDAALLIHQALKNTGITGQPDTITEDRKQIRNYLANLNRYNAAQSLNSSTYFDENGDAADKQLFIGIYSHGSVISALGQIRPVWHPDFIMNIEEDIEKGYIFRIGNYYMYKTNIVYTGVELRKISGVDGLLNRSCLLDFYIWFRYQDEFDVQNIEFANAVEPIRLRWDDKAEPEVWIRADESEEEKTEDASETCRLVRKETIGNMTSVLYRISAHFKNEIALDSPYTSGYHVGFKFHHQDLSRNNLVYVTDFIGMGVKDAGTFSERAKKNTAVDSAEGWAVDNVVFAHDTIEKSTTGSLKHLENPIKYAEHSQFDVSISLKNTAALNVRRKLIPEGFAGYLAIFCCVMLVFLIKIENTLLKNRPKTVWLFQFIVALLLIHSAETFLTKELLKDAAPKYRIVGIAVFDVLFCLVPALFVHLAMQVFIWGPMEQRSGRPVPTVLRHIPVYLIYFIAGYAVIVFVFNLDINKLVATSGVLAMGIGLLIKDNIANYLASIAIFHNHELRIGHWVKIGDFEEGKVQEITRMVTRIMKREGTLLSIPNSVVLNSAIENYSLPGDDYLLTFRLETVPEYSPVEVLQVIETGILSVEGVLKDPAPIIVFEGQGDSSAKYTIMFSVRDYDKKYHYLTAGWKGVWLNLEKAGIELATPHRVIHLLDETPESRTD